LEEETDLPFSQNPEEGFPLLMIVHRHAEIRNQEPQKKRQKETGQDL
jgi:hypothetical protein